MNTIELKDTEARISKITNDAGVVTVELEWGGPSDRSVTNFDLDQLGKIARGLGSPYGGNLRTGWVILDGECDLEEGETIPLLEANVGEIVAISGIHGELPGSVDVSIRNAAFVRVALQWEHVNDKNEITDAGYAHIETEVKRKGGFDEVEWNTKA